MNKKEKILDILSTILGKTIDETCCKETEDTWDSMSHIEIIVTIEEEFGVKFEASDIPTLTSVSNIIAALEKLC